jgi:thioredoxin reductase (NADPH)
MNHSHAQAVTQQQADFIKQLKTTFEKMPHDIELLLFTQKEKEDAFAEGSRQIVRAFRELTSRIRLREFSLDHEMAGKYQIEHSPTLLIAPDRYGIRWMGAPLGEEARTFLETILMVGSGASGLSGPSRKVISNIDSPRLIKVFVSPSSSPSPKLPTSIRRTASRRRTPTTC